MALQPLRIGVSACLLGARVRWDGGHKREPLLAACPDFIEWTPLCPEVELGLGVPREPIALRGRRRLRLVGVRSGRDLTREMQRFAVRRAAELRAMGLAGAVLKRGSPSCGLAQAPLRRAFGGGGRGIFAGALLAAAPGLPAIEEEALHHPALRAHWAERVFAYRRLQALGPAQLADFHAHCELQLEAHTPGSFAGLARHVERRDCRAYGAAFMAALAKPLSRRRCAALLRRASQRLGGKWTAQARADWERLCRGYRRGRLPLCAPAGRLAQHARQLGRTALAAQSLLAPEPGELWLRGA